MTTTKTKVRQSNIELLRFVSMILIMILHSDFFSIPNPIVRWLFVMGGDLGVNCFILISGYFTIRPKVKSFASFIFQILFFIVIGNLLYIWGGRDSRISLNILELNWFINSYIALFFFAPVLNAFAEKATEKEFRMFLITWAIVEFILGYTVDYLRFERGNSFQAFILIYLIARYIKLHGGKLTTFNKFTDLSICIIFIIISALLLTISKWFGKEQGAIYYLHAYNSPFIIVACIYLLLFFTKIKLQSTIINKIGKAAFAAFLLHAVMMTWYGEICRQIFANYNYILAIFIIFLFIFTVYFVAFVIDKLRFALWKNIEKIIAKIG